MKKLPEAGIFNYIKENSRKSSLFKRICAFLLLILCGLQLNAQGHQITGTVMDLDGVTLPGVNILIEGTTTGTITDIDGAFTITAPNPQSILVVSYVGYTRQRVPVEGRNIINIELVPELRALDEVVVVGYGTRMREELTGSVSSMSGDRMEISTAPSALGRIQGQVSGVHVTTANRPGGGATIRVRGLGTINDSNPLYIIDGVPAGPGNNLNPNDIESISVLKDASSAAIYGTRGANGVIIITTRRGRDGQRPSINFNVRSGITQATNQYDLLNTQERAEMEWLMAQNRGYTLGVDWSHPQYGNGLEPVIPNYILPAGSTSANYDSYSYPGTMIFAASKPGTNWYDEIYRNGLIQEYDLSITGATDNVNYSFSGGYLNEEGFLIHTNFERFTFRNSADARFANWLRAGQSLNVSYINEFGNLSDNGEGTPISQAYRSQPIIPVYDINGNFAGSRAPGMGNSGNPVAMLYRARNNNGRNFRVLGNIYGEATIMEGLQFRTMLGYNVGQWNYRGMSLANFEHNEPSSIDGLSQNTNYSIQWNWQNTINYTTTLADIHRLNVILGTEAIENEYRNMSAGRNTFFSTDPNFMQLSTGEANPTVGGGASEWSLFSVFGRVNYDLMGRYLFEATLRRDGSSRFGPDNRWATFPAASFAWALSQESFMAGTRNWLDFLKLRVGWGISGNDRIGNYNTYTTYGTHQHYTAYPLDGSNTSTQIGFQPSNVGNPGVTWETTETLNTGIDVTLFNSTVNFTADVWRRYTHDMLYRLSVPQVMGVATPPFVNIGEMKNVGFDIELGYNNTAMGGRFRYNVTGSISRYVNEIMKLSEDVHEEIIMGGLRQMNYSRAAVGTSYPEFYGYIVDGIFQTQAEADNHARAFGAEGTYNQPGRFMYRDINGDGVIDANDMTYIGSPHPDFTGGLNVDLGYGNFDLNMFFYGSYGNDMINYVRRWIDFGMFNGGMSKNALYNSWGSPYLASNADATLPRIDHNDGSERPSTHFIEDGSFLRMKNLRLGYRVPQSVTNRLQVNNIRLYCQMTNLFTITNYSGLDPELHSSGGSMGLDQGAWPTPRQIMFGVSLGL